MTVWAVILWWIMDSGAWRHGQLCNFGMHKESQDDGFLRTFLDTDAAADTLTRQQPAKRNIHDLMIDLKSCSTKRDLQWGKRVHTRSMETGDDSNMYVAAALITMYAKCGSMVDARRVFDKFEKLDVVSWTALILGYADNGEGLVALDLFFRMKDACRCAPNSVTYVAALKACTSLAVGEKGKCLKMGRVIHSKIGCHLNRYVQSTLIDMYAKCGSMVDAHLVFESIQEPDSIQDVVSWNALILGYADNGGGHVALDLFCRMKGARVCTPNSVTYIAAIKACTSLAVNGDIGKKADCLKLGRDIHLEIGCHAKHVVLNTLIDMYANCGSMVDARRVFDSMHERDVVSWNALILGYADNGSGHVALELFSRMKAEHSCAPDCVTYIAVFKACGLIGALALGRMLHLEIRDFSAHVVTCLVDFYSKCGSMVEAYEVFDLQSKVREVSTWNVLLAGYSSFGDSFSVFKVFGAMQDQDFQPNAVTFVHMLSCCGHAGLVDTARKYFEVMHLQYGVTPDLLHYNCMIDNLGRANQLDEAVALLQKMPFNSNTVTWMALLGACRKWKNVEVGRLAFHSLVDIDEKNASAYVLMAQIYSSRGMWDEQERVLEMRMNFGAGKLLGQAYVMDDLEKMVKFVVGKEDQE